MPVSDRSHTSRVASRMSTEKAGLGAPAPRIGLQNGVSISKWVNETFPPWDEILSAHDVARLTRRRRWVLSTLTLLRCFPRKLQYHGRDIGWNRCAVESWLAERFAGDLGPRRCDSRSHGTHRLPSQNQLQYSRSSRSARIRPSCFSRETRFMQAHESASASGVLIRHSTDTADQS